MEAYFDTIIAFCEVKLMDKVGILFALFYLSYLILDLVVWRFEKK